MGVPVIDISGDRARVASAVGRAVEEIGFLVIAGHGVPAATLDAMRRAARALFARPEAEKAALARALAVQLDLDTVPAPGDASDALAIAACHVLLEGVGLLDGAEGAAPRLAPS